MNTHILSLKVGKVKTITLENHSKKQLISAINKTPINSSYLTKTGFVDDEQADTKHHGGESKAVLILSDSTYKSLNSILNTNFDYDKDALYGENIVISNLQEKDICLADRFQIGKDVIIEVSQPREPCWKLSAHTNNKKTTSIIYNEGLTGWYAKVIKEGEVSNSDEIKLISRIYPSLSISILNKLAKDPYIDEELTKVALASKELTPAFKKAIMKRYKN